MFLESPLVSRWSLIVAGIHLFGAAVLLDPQGCYNIPMASGDFHLLHRNLGISVGLPVAVEPSSTVLPSMLGTPKPFWALPS